MMCCYPDIAADRMRDLIDFAAWNCLLDDFVENGPLSNDLPGMTHFLKSIGYICDTSNYLCPSDFGFDRDYRIAKALVDVKSRISAWASSVQIHNLMCATSHFMSGLAWEVAYTNMKQTPDLNTYCAIRTANSGMYMANALAECVNNVELTPAERACPEIQALTQCILFVLVIDNDLYSHHKEKSGCAAFPSMIDILMHSRGSKDTHAALLEALDLRNQCMRCYLALKAKCRRSFGNRLDIYFKGLEDIISGNLVFGSTCARYAAPGSPQFLGTTNAPYVRADSIQIPVADALDLPVSPPRHIPSIDWWWTLVH
ncbi:Predicted BioA alternative protein [Burkholderia singularis]|uniref:Terpene synthase n=2 Tax=Burkholderiaceae TaxID=119060 RepID=A0A238HAZ0_9BURK|nr:Predicted BioA alternative protein [Burkholderia singularis]